MSEPTLQKNGTGGLLIMKKSALYKLAQIAVVNSLTVQADIKLEILQELMAAEKLAKFGEEREEKGDDE